MYSEQSCNARQRQAFITTRAGLSHGPRIRPGHACLALLLVLIWLLAPAGRAAAQDNLISVNTAIHSHLCIGYNCGLFENYSDHDTLRFRDANTRLRFDDMSSSGGGYPDTDWRLIANDSHAGGESYFAVENASQGQVALRIMADAAEAALTLRNDRAGLGTTLPEANLHIEGSLAPSILMRQNTSAGGAARSFLLGVADAGLFLGEAGNAGMLTLAPDAPMAALELGSGETRLNGQNADHDLRIGGLGGSLLFADAAQRRIGINTDQPATALHLRGTQGDGALLIEETSAGTLGQLTLRNNGITYFTLEDSSITAGDYSGRSWNFQNQGGTFRVTTAPGGPGEIEMMLTPQGDMHIKGQLYTGTGGAGTTCAAGCDRVFDEDYYLPAISEHVAAMRRLRHLPAVGPTPETGPFNISQMTGGMLNELEIAHLYIAQLHNRLETLESLWANIDSIPVFDEVLSAQSDSLAAQSKEIAKLRAEIDRLRGEY